MKLSNRELVDITSFAKDEYVITKKDRHETHDSYLARCWVAAMVKVIKREGYNVMILTKDNQLSELEIS